MFTTDCKSSRKRRRIATGQFQGNFPWKGQAANRPSAPSAVHRQGASLWEQRQSECLPRCHPHCHPHNAQGYSKGTRRHCAPLQYPLVFTCAVHALTLHSVPELKPRVSRTPRGELQGIECRASPGSKKNAGRWGDRSPRNPPPGRCAKWFRSAFPRRRFRPA